MDSARWEQIQALFHDALEHPESGRQAFLEAACGNDPEVMAEVLTMLRADSRSTSLLDRGLPEVAYQMVGAPVGAVPFQQIGPYRFKRVLGEGGMGVVCLAEREDSGNLVAIKLLPHASLSPARRERFVREIKTLAKLKHPFIARLYDAGTLADGTPWFAMEYVGGAQFTDYCRRQDRPMEERLRLFRAVCEAVEYAHRQEIIHRDLKPSNIMVEKDGTPRLLDFGIAKQLQDLDSASDQTRPELRFRSPDYAAPEWVRDGIVRSYTDVYSLGVILYEVLTGQLPVERSKRAPEVAENNTVEQLPDKPSVAARRLAEAGGAATEVPRLDKAAWSDLDVLCLKAMHQDAKARYPSVEALIRDIDHYLKGEPLEARPDTLHYRVGKFVRRNRRAVLAGALGFVLVVGLVVFFTVRLAKARDQANRETAIATAMNRFLSDDLLGQSDPFKSGDAKESFVDVVNRASPEIDLQFSTEPVVAARLHQTIAKAFDNRSDFPQASQEYDRASNLFMRAEGPLSPDAIVVNLQRAAIEARSSKPGSLALAKSRLSDAQTSIARIARPREDLEVWLLSTQGVIAIAENDPRSASGSFSAALRRAQAISSFDEVARRRIRMELAFSYIHLGEAAKAEPLLRETIAAFSETGGPENPEALRVRVNLSQALLAQQKYAEAMKEANLIYPAIVKRLGVDHEVTMSVLGARAASEGNLGMWDEAIRDDLAFHDIAVRKQGPTGWLSIAALSDAAQSQCQAGRYGEGEANARRAFEQARRVFGPRAGVTGGTSYSLAICLMGLNQLREASDLLQNIDVKATTQLSADPTVSAEIALAQGEIAARQGSYTLARKYAETATPALDRPNAPVSDRESLQKLRKEIESHLRAPR